jgi:hypothetical protein
MKDVIKKNFLKLSRKEYDRLIEDSPDLPMTIIRRFRKNLKKLKI